MNKKIFNKFKKIKKEYVLVGVLVLISIIFIYNTFSEKTSNSTSNKIEVSNSTENYIDNLENKLVTCISNIKGVGKVKVKISANTSFKNIYLTNKEIVNSNGTITTKEEPVIIGGKTIILEELPPEIQGVIVVAGGSDRISVKTKIINVCTTLLNVSSTQVLVLNGK